MIDEGARDSDALLLAAGKPSGEMRDAIGKSHASEHLASFLFIRGAVKILGEHHVFECAEIRDEMKLLEHEADFFSAETREARFIEASDVGAVHDGLACGGRIEATENINKSGLAGA